MAKIIVQFDTEQQAEQFLERLNQENLGEIRARVLDQAGGPVDESEGASTPMITPEMGTVEVRSTEKPVVPDQEQDVGEPNVSANVPVKNGAGVQVMIEVDDAHEGTVRQLLRT